MISCNFSDRFEVGNIEAWVTYGLTKERLGLFGDGRGVVLWIVGVDKFYVDAKFRKDVIKLSVSTTI